MSYNAPIAISAHSLAGNSAGSPALQTGITLDSTLSMSGSVLTAPDPGTRSTTGSITILTSDDGKRLTSTDATGVNYTLPAGFPAGFRCRSYQGGAGQISYVAGSGASIANGSPVSGGLNSSGFYADIENVGSDTWIVTGNHA